MVSVFESKNKSRHKMFKQADLLLIVHCSLTIAIWLLTATVGWRLVTGFLFLVSGFLFDLS